MAYPSSVDLASLGAIFNLKALHTVLWALSFGINIWNGVVGVNAFKAIRPSPPSCSPPRPKRYGKLTIALFTLLQLD